jgi:hypothetical protein
MLLLSAAFRSWVRRIFYFLLNAVVLNNSRFSDPEKMREATNAGKATMN